MHNSRLSKFQTVLSVLFFIFTIFSVTLIAAEVNHENHCNEDNCPICFVIQVVKVNLGGLILSLAVYKTIHNFVKAKKLIFSSISKSYISNTLFSLKIRLND